MPFGVVERPGADILPCGDKGGFKVTKSVSDEYAFHVPQLRNIALTARHFQTGKVWDLRQAGAIMGSSQLGATLSDDDVSQIENFPGALTGDQPKAMLPILPPSVASTPQPKP